MFKSNNNFIAAINTVAHPLEMGVCNTPECLRSSEDILKSMNQDIDPCNDFYQFTCGNYQAAHQRPYWTPSFSFDNEIEESHLNKIVNYLAPIDMTSNVSELVQKAKNVFDACMDTEKLDELGFQPIVKYLIEFNLPIIPSIIINNETEINSSIEFKCKLVETLAHIRETFDTDFIMDIDLAITRSNDKQESSSDWSILLSYPNNLKNDLKRPTLVTI